MSDILETIARYAKDYHWLIRSPFTDGGLWVVGLTPKGVTGWNGRPDYEGAGATLEAAIHDAEEKLRHKEIR